MKRFVLTGVVAALMLAGCGGKEQSAGMTQPIASVQTQSQTAAQETTEAGSASAVTSVSSENGQTENTAAVQTEAGSKAPLPSASGDPVQDLDTYCQVKAEKEAVEIEISNLEAAYRVGSLDEQSFQSQRTALKDQERELERMEETLEDGVERYYYQNSQAPQGDISSLLDQLSQVDSEKYQQENQKDQLKLQYRNGEISREDFINGMKENIQQEEALDVQEELLEDSLERLGWDD